jgi:hypothetical protein
MVVDPRSVREWWARVINLGEYTLWLVVTRGLSVDDGVVAHSPGGFWASPVV